MSPYRAKPGYKYKIKIRLPDGRSGTFSTGTSLLPLARAVDEFVTKLIRNRKWEALDGIVSKRLKLPDLFDRYERHGMQGVDAAIAESLDTDLSPLVESLLDDEKYIAQVRRMIPANKPFPASRFVRSNVASFLDGLTMAKSREAKPVSASTRKRYKAAISAFAQSLIERDIIDTNPARDIVDRKTRGESSRKEIVYLEPEEVKQLVSVLPTGQFQALEALMAGSAIEWGAATSLEYQDIDFEARIVFAKGTKNAYRTRYIEVTEDWCWEIFSEYARGLKGQGRLFKMTPDQALAQHYNATAALGLKRTTLHNHRNSFAVMWIRRGVYGIREDRRDRQWLKNQLGHAPQSTLIDTTYGVYINAAKLTEAQLARQTGSNVIPINKKRRA